MSADPNNMVTKQTAPKLIKQAYDKVFTRTNIVAGFESTAIYHWNPLAISKEVFMPSDPFDNANHNNSSRLCYEHPLQWVLRDEENEVNVIPRHFSNGQNSILESVTEVVANAKPSSAANTLLKLWQMFTGHKVVQ